VEQKSPLFENLCESAQSVDDLRISVLSASSAVLPNSCLLVLIRGCFYFLYARTSGNAGGSRPSSSSFNGKTVHLTSVLSGRISEGVAREKNFEDFQKGLDSISRFAPKGCCLMMCARDVKKQINPAIKAHLLRSALILFSLVTFNQDIFCQTPTPTATATPSPTVTATPSPIATATPSPSGTCSIPTPGACTSYEAESSNNTLEGSAFVLSCPTCSGGLKVGYVGNNSGTLQFNGVGVVVAGNHTVTICYLNGDAVRYALLSVNGGQGMPVSFPSTGSFQTVGSIQITVTLNTGCNTLEFYNPIVGDWAPDFDRIQFNCPTCTVSVPSTTPTPTPTQTPTPAPTPTPTRSFFRW
jgi:alpha-galactosidase-like CBM13-containing protein